ncbi:hypothetical protein EYC84_005559 [Monilinia fructicola]|uniref:Uncharacterized protein n=1 Tax=Monilinia fructicola TaxID=38448 RepID=A0A5M9JZS3_MONFR|nr:hypothetical protein EYC84_005559 [Monilinia fructicola]
MESLPRSPLPAHQRDSLKLNQRAEDTVCEQPHATPAPMTTRPRPPEDTRHDGEEVHARGGGTCCSLCVGLTAGWEDDGKALELARARLGAVEFYASFHRGWKEDFALGVWNSKSDLGMDMVWAWVWAWVWGYGHVIGLDWIGWDSIGWDYLVFGKRLLAFSPMIFGAV